MALGMGAVGGRGGDRLAPAGLSRAPLPRQSAGTRPARCTMELFAAIIYILLLASVSCKISGGPRGRFDNDKHKKPAHHVSAHHTHYSYHPPTHIKFICRHCTTITTYPVYHGLPPTYVYKYRESGTRFGALLTGLALYNLGRSSEYWHQSHYYTQRDDEQCSMQVIDRAHFEETTFPCFMMSSFLERAEIKGSDSRTFDITTTQVNVKPYLQATGAPIVVTREQECVVWHNTTVNKERNVIPCALLKEYSETMKPAGVPVYIWLPTTIGIVVAIAVCCQNSCRKRKEFKDDEGSNSQSVVDGYLITYN